ncbi:MAG TPA: hypothetical protein VN688_16090 [Gemmataceae bacterium]|nr:hypothetical protein [Gemmataceae bacterium]
MASSITNTLMTSSRMDYPLSVEYSLSLADHHALDMFRYDKILRKSARFRLKFYGQCLLEGGVGAAIIGLMLWGLFKAIGSVLPLIDPLVPLRLGCGTALLYFLVILLGMIPDSFLHRKARKINDKRFWQARLAQLQAGLLRYPQCYRVVLTPEWFTETVSYQETNIAVAIIERKETRVWWTTVARIDVTAEHAFFIVRDKGNLVLPRTAFAEEATFLTFVDTARAYREAALLKSAPKRHLPPSPNTGITS